MGLDSSHGSLAAGAISTLKRCVHAIFLMKLSTSQVWHLWAVMIVRQLSMNSAKASALYIPYSLVRDYYASVMMMIRWCRCERQEKFPAVFWKNSGKNYVVFQKKSGNLYFFLPFTPAPSYGDYEHGCAEDDDKNIDDNDYGDDKNVDDGFEKDDGNAGGVDDGKDDDGDAHDDDNTIMLITVKDVHVRV